jgi:hypothetical protein
MHHLPGLARKGTKYRQSPPNKPIFAKFDKTGSDSSLRGHLIISFLFTFSVRLDTANAKRKHGNSIINEQW